MDRNKKPPKRLFPSPNGLSGSLSIQTNHTETVTEWMAKLASNFTGFLTFIPYVMGEGGFQKIDSGCFNIDELQKLKTQRKYGGKLKIYAMVKGKGILFLRS